ncbi:hypothetical protein PsAD5_00509 [Pseudovibrio sp. Ad5]|uniref:winged helix-turn-helix domain-containing protein n=1 Tax=Pseudovibrio sp. Ad5 TaxID=989436 RepID=UPI0007AE3C18|nr:winged helix-turn-helix domain-containing protein [Pseudovibrio sp. Ad5]KZL01587.1 hypothetical protein PsAD5_00509 [Pseudovibrio sp. Ad5]
MREFRNIEEWRREFSVYPMDSGTCLVLHTISLFATDINEPFSVTIHDLGERCNLSKPSVIKHLKKAWREGWIGVRHYDGVGAKLMQKEYLLKSPEMNVEGWV